MTGRAATIVVLAALGCGQRGDGPTDHERRAVPRDPRLDVALPAEAVRVDGPNFHVLAAPIEPCGPSSRCTIAADLHADNGFKVNPDYPYKLVDASVALAAPASFGVLSTTRGRLLVAFERTSPDPITVRGSFKLSVCSADVCQIETAPLAVRLP